MRRALSQLILNAPARHTVGDRMASYVESVLAPGERIVHRASLSHWRYALSYLVGGALIFGGLAVYVAASSDRNFLIASLALMAVGLLLILVALVRRHTTEL